ncbi:hypothetical protein Pcinc_012408 [Petrolisthes cinctipes]|uniref:Transposase n=1 Tax=Petrolisthes cinctipes TaxID=88211 RepID=A0AAE1G0R8_PETCI|nr:hypothetical protein Pcinc_012408 [Petrolisthes cinctipes]
MGAVTTSKEERARILALRIENVPIKEICSRTGRHKTTVMRILAAARRLPPSQVPIPKPRPGRRKKTTKEIDCLLKMEVVNNPFISANELKKMYPRELQNVAERTIRHRLQIDLGLTCRPTRICEGRRMRRRVENWRLPTTVRQV